MMSHQAPEHSGKTAALSDNGLVWLCYVLYLMAVFFGGTTAVIAVFINYLKRDCESEVARSHLNRQIRTFWLAVLFAVILAIATFILYMSVVGALLIYPLWLGYVLWFAYRQIKGMLALNSGSMI